MMFKLLALTSVLTSAVLAGTNDAANPLIPSEISSTCASFLNDLNADATLASCLSTLKNITSEFAPGASNPSSSDVTSTLANLCTSSVTSACPESLIRTDITKFYSGCNDELTTKPNQLVRNMYEVLYTIYPLQQSICSKDDSGDFCVKGPSITTRDFDEDASFSFSKLLALLYIKTDNGALTRRDQAIVPNITAISQSNSMFLYFTPDLNKDKLCVSCLREIMAAYIDFESNIPLAYELDNSTLLSGQLPLYNAIQSKCPANFLSGAVQAAGGLSGSSSSAIPTYSAAYQRIMALVMGAVTLVISIAL